MNLLYDSFTKKADILSKALEKATERTRTMLYVVTFFSLLITVTAFNAYLAWDRKLNAQDRVLLSKEIKIIPKYALSPYNNELAINLANAGMKVDTNTIDDEIVNVIKQVENSENKLAKKHLHKYIQDLHADGLLLPPSNYFDYFSARQKFTIPIIGLSCYADDVYLIGGLGLLILLTYSFFNVRRENRIVERIKATIDYIKNTDHHKLGINMTDNMQIKLIRHNMLEYVYYGCVEFFIFNTGNVKIDYPSKVIENDKTNKPGRNVIFALYFLPVFSLGFALLFEVISLFLNYSYMNDNDYWELGIRYIVTILFFIFIIRQCIFINRLNLNTANLLSNIHVSVIESRNQLELK